MSLLTFAPDFAFCSHNMGSTPVGQSINFGAGVTAGASNTDGSAATILSAATHDIEYLIIGISGFGSTAGSGVNPSTLLDIMHDPAGGTSWLSDPLIEKLLVGGTYPINLQSATVGTGTPLWYFFPLFIPAGTTLGGRARTAHSSTITGRVVVYAYGGNRNPGTWWSGRKVTSIGIDAAASRGQDHTPGSTGSFSTWANLGSALTLDGQAYQFAVQGKNDAAWTGSSSPYWWQFGVNSVQVGPTIIKGHTSQETGLTFPTGPLFRSFKTGQQLMVRATALSTAETLDCAAYIVS